MLKKIQIFCGISVEDNCGKQLHPINEVKKAKNLIDFGHGCSYYSNSTDFIAAIKIYGLEKGVETEFFLDGESQGNDIEKIFEGFNKSFELINEICPKSSRAAFYNDVPFPDFTNDVPFEK